MNVTKVQIELDLSTEWDKVEENKVCQFMFCGNPSQYKSRDMGGMYVALDCGGSSGSCPIYFCESCYYIHKEIISNGNNEKNENKLKESTCTKKKIVVYDFYNPQYHAVYGGTKIKSNNPNVKGKYSFRY